MTRGYSPEPKEGPNSKGGDVAGAYTEPTICAAQNEGALSFEKLWKSSVRCQRGVTWKGSVAHSVLYRIEEIIDLEEKLANVTYKPHKMREFKITRPKVRTIRSQAFLDRVVQNSLVENVIMPGLGKSFLYCNCACQTNKGTDYARNMLRNMLRSYYRKAGRNGWVLYYDVSSFFASIRHCDANARIKSVTNGLEAYYSVQALDQYPGVVGYDPGSPLVQVSGLAALDKLDHRIKEYLGVKYYIRYMDDAVIVDSDRETLLWILEDIRSWLWQYGFVLNPKKSGVFPLSQGVRFLGFDYSVTETGKVHMVLPGKRVRQIKRDMRRLVKAVKSGKVSIASADMSAQCWIAYASKGDSKALSKSLKTYWKTLTGDLREETI